jgi:hypothetical protein
MNKTYTASLSRWHKVAERLSRQYTETAYKATQVLTQTSLSTYVGEGQEQELKEQATEWTSRLDYAFRQQDCVCNIRQALGSENARTGVTVELATSDKLNRRQKTLTRIIEAQTSEMITISQLKNTPREYVADGDSFQSRRPPIRIRMLDHEQVRKLQEELESIRSEAYALSDRIAELNRVNLSLELDEEIAKSAGLK